MTFQEAHVVIRRIEPLSLARVLGIFYGVVGVIVAFFVLSGIAVGFIVPMVLTRQLSGGAFLIAVAVAILLPLLYGGIGFVVSIIAASIYNLIAGRIGGIVIDVD
jgi:hypothetical protein